MKKLILCTLIALCALPVAAQTPNGSQGFGALIGKDTDPQFVGYTAVNLNIRRDTTADVTIFDRTGVFYADPDSVHGEFKGAFTQLATRFYFAPSKIQFYIELGGKILLVSDEGPDYGAGGLGFAAGAKVWKTLGVQAGVDWLTIPGEKSRFLVTAAVDFLP